MKRAKKPRTWLIVFAILPVVALLGIGTLATMVFLAARDSKLPQIETASDYQPLLTTRVYDRHGILLGEIYRERRSTVPLERIPRTLVQAVIAAEDSDYYQHRGLDYMGMLRAFFTNVRAGRLVQGGSTITQQVVKTFFLTPERTLKRKLQEVVLARRIEQALSKDEILYLYLNQIYLGHGRYGVEEASRFYFGHGVEDINLDEATLLAGLPQAPEGLSPIRHPDRAKKRQIYVIDRMEALGMIDGPRAQTSRMAPLPLAKTAQVPWTPAPEVIDIVSAYLAEKLGSERVPYLGASVTTTIDAKMQAAAREALESGLRALDERQGLRRALRRVSGKTRAKHLEQQKKRTGPTWEAVVSQVNAKEQTATVDLGSRSGVLYLKHEKRYQLDGALKPGDVLRVRLAPEQGEDSVALEQGPQGALVALDTASGEVRAIVGGYGFSAGGFNRALRAQRQPGSAFKPIVYAAAIESERLTPASVLIDSPEVFAEWKPQNYEAQPSRGPVRLRQALAESINTVAVKVLQETSIEAAVLMARRLGIGSPLARDLSLALGSSAVTPIEMAQAFSVFASGGQRTEPSFIVAVNDEKESPPQRQPVLSPEAAFVMTDLLRSVVDEGTGRGAKKLGRAAAGKTGTSNDSRDAWFVGFTPELCAAVWVGFDEPRPLGRGEAGGRAAVPIWTDFMLAAHEGLPVRSFRMPPGVVVVRIDPQTGLRATGEEGIDEVFVANTEPTDIAPDSGEVDPETFLMEQLAPIPTP